MDRQTPAEKSIYRQISENDSTRNHFEKILRDVNKCTVVNGNDAGQFTAASKLNIQQSLRAALHQNYEQKQFLAIAKEHGFAAAEHFKSSGAAEDEGTLTPEMKKRVEDTKKKYGESTQKRTSSFPKQQQQQQSGHNYFQQQMYNPSMQAPSPYVNPYLAHSSPHPMTGQQLLQPQYNAFGNLVPQALQGMNAFAAQQFQSQPPGPMPTRFRGRFPKPPIDKTNSTCKACGLLGHWAGDAACNLSGFPKSQGQAAPGTQASPFLSLPPPSATGQPGPPGS